MGALAALVFLVAMGFISEEGARWSGFGRIAILLLLGVAWWNNETQVDL